MKTKTFYRDNATVTITIPTEEQMKNIKKATEDFLRKVLIEESKKIGNNNSSGTVQKK